MNAGLRVALACLAVAAALLPAAFGLVGNASFSRQVPVPSPPAGSPSGARDQDHEGSPDSRPDADEDDHGGRHRDDRGNEGAGEHEDEHDA